MGTVDSIQPPAEQRRWPRVDEELLFTCWSRGHVGQTSYFTKNISGGGMLFESQEAIPLGTELDVAYYAPLDCGKQTRWYVRVRAQVRWTGEIPGAVSYEGSNRYRIGVAFDDISPEAQTCLDAYVKKRLMMASTERLA